MQEQDQSQAHNQADSLRRDQQAMVPVQPVSSAMDVDMLPFLPQREPSALDTLAEVSRQLQANGMHGSDDVLMAQLQQHMEEPNEYSVHDQTRQGASCTPTTTPPRHDHAASSVNGGTALFSSINAHDHARPLAIDADVHDNSSEIHTNVPNALSSMHAHTDYNAQPDACANLDTAPTNVSVGASMDVTQRTDDAMLVDTSTTFNERLAEAAMQLTQSSQPHSSRGRKRKAPAAARPDPSIPNSYLSDYTPRVASAAGDNHLGQQTINSQDLNVQSRRQENVPSQPQTDHSNDDQSPTFTINQGGFGLLQRFNKTKARGRFSEDRRKEVQVVRKKGACLRCRMLKKPCSEGTPCNTCKNIETARLWKQACIRTRVADEFVLYSTTYFYTKDRSMVYASLNGIEPRTVPGRIEVTLSPDHHIYATFSAMKTNRAARPADDLDALINSSQNDDSDSPDMFLLSFKTEDTLALKLERYMSAVLVQAIASEPSRVMRSTLEFAAELTADHDDVLLTKFIHLWVVTNILVTKDPLWTICYNSCDSPMADHTTIVDETAGQGETSVRSSDDGRVYFDPGSPDYDIMCGQLRDAAERYCQKQAKTCMNELERRLVQRQQVPSFLTFLGAVILLNCVERMTALFYSFDPHPRESETQHARSEHEPGADGVVETTISGPGDQTSNKLDDAGAESSDAPSDWPLQEPPSRFWPQGGRFASLLHLLLRMRGLPPTVHIRDDGSLAILSNFNKAYPVEVASDTADGDSQQVLAAKWVERTDLAAKDLWWADGMSDAEAGKKAWGDNGTGARAWDLRFIAPLLLP